METNNYFRNLKSKKILIVKRLIVVSTWYNNKLLFFNIILFVPVYGLEIIYDNYVSAILFNYI